MRIATALLPAVSLLCALCLIRTDWSSWHGHINGARGDFVKGIQVWNGDLTR